MNANYTESCRVGNLEEGFLTSSAYSFFSEFLRYCCETSMIQFQGKNNKYFLRKKKKKNEIENDFTIEKKETEKTNGF